MGTSNSYSGGGGAAGGRLRRELDDWLDSLPDKPPSNEDDGAPRLPADAIRHVLPMLRPSSGGGADGPGGGGGSGGGGAGASGAAGGAQRSARASATTAGRAAAAAHALRLGDAAALERIGLDLDALRANGDPFDVACQIVDATCGAMSDGTIEDEERRAVAFEVAEWVLTEGADGVPPSPEDIVRKSVAAIVAEAALSETGDQIRRGERPAWVSPEAERQLREAAEVLAEQVDIPLDGLTEAGFTKAVEDGIETLRAVWGTS